MPLKNHDRSTHADFRYTTDKLVRTLPGVAAPSFLCRVCGQQRLVAGRKRYIKGDTRSGWVCAACAK